MFKGVLAGEVFAKHLISTSPTPHHVVFERKSIKQPKGRLNSRRRLNYY